MGKKHIMLFDLYAGGHHGYHLEQMVTYWQKQHFEGVLEIVVPSFFPQYHPRLIEYINAQNKEGIYLTIIEEDLPWQPSPGSEWGLYTIGRIQKKMIQKYVARSRPDHCVLMYFDHAQLALATGLRFDFSVALSGIYFRPTIHYTSLNHKPPSVSERIQSLRKKLLLSIAVRNRHFRTLFCLDPYVVPYAQELNKTFTAVALPDGIDYLQSTSDVTSLHEELGIEAGRKVMMLFGVLNRRKGVVVLLEALQRIPNNIQEKICVVLAGSVSKADKVVIYNHTAHLRNHSKVQVILYDEYVSDSFIQDLFLSCDIALVPYVQHVGSSGVLVRAAAAQRPVLGSDYGTVGAHIRRYKLGMAVDTTDVEALATSIRQCIEQGMVPGYEATSAQQFADENTVEQFMSTFYQHILNT